MSNPEEQQTVNGDAAEGPSAGATTRTKASISRRQMLQRSAVAGGAVVWATPVVQSLMAKAAAASAPPSGGNTGGGGATQTGPVLANVETTPLSYKSQSAPVVVTSTLTLTDTGDSTIAGATVSVTSGFAPGEDALLFTNQNGIIGSYDSSTGVLTLVGSATVADYQAALRSVRFFSSDTSASPASRTISFTVTDALAETSNTASRSIDVSAAV